jgi:hypothetical protein
MAFLAAAVPAHAQWTVVYLHPAPVHDSDGYGIGGGQQVGATHAAPGSPVHAALWTGSAASWVDLNPGGIVDSSEAFAAGGGQQVGDVHIAGGTSIHASLWSGTAASWVDLNPPGALFSDARGVRAGQQAGYGEFGTPVVAQSHAGLWTGTAASWVDLHPLGSINSQAFATDGVRQVGYADIGPSGVDRHASLWSGSAASWVDLHPAGASVSLAVGVHGGQQVGVVNILNGPDRASLWSGTAASWVDLSPAGSQRSDASAVDAGEQVGHATYPGPVDHAGLWRGSAASWVDLHAFLTPDYDYSYADGISHNGGFTYVVGTAHNIVLGREEAVMWVSEGPCTAPPVNDECYGALPAALGLNPFDNTCATTSLPPATCGLLGSDLWYSFTPPFAGVLTVSTCGLTGADTALAIYGGCVPPSSIACNDDFCGVQSSVSICAEVRPYLFRIGGYNGARWVGNFNVTLSPAPVDETGQLPATSVVSPGPTINGVLSDCPANDVDMYIIHICSPANFTATVNPGGTSISDTQLFLFNMSGTGVAMNDDDPLGINGLRSRLTGPIVQSIPAGDYLLAISSYDNDPIDSGSLAIWADSPYNTVRAPDGPGAFNAIANWDNAGGAGGAYQIDLTGTSTAPCGPGFCCLADFNGDGDIGTDADIEDFFACLGGNCCATCPPDADFNCDGDIGTDADIQSFFSVLSGGSC